jgi:hypothetical protein
MDLDNMDNTDDMDDIVCLTPFTQHVKLVSFVREEEGSVPLRDRMPVRIAIAVKHRR